MTYFTLEELTHSATAQAHSIANVPTAEAVKNLETLVVCVLDPLRKAWGSPIIVTSGYRCEELNRKVGGAPYSYHRLGMAADIRPKNGYIHIAYDAEDSNTWPFIAK